MAQNGSLSRNLTLAQRTEVFDKTAAKVTKQYFDPRFNGTDWPRLARESREQIISRDDPEQFELGMHDLVRKLGTSHTGFFHQSVRRVDQRAYKGNIDTPKGRKGKRTSRTVGLSPGTIAELKVWRALLLKQEPESYLFPTERETPLRRDNVWYRDLLPKLKPVGLEWATFQVLRRTNASLSRRAMIDDKVAADQRGHGLGVSLEVYSISGVQQKIDAAKRLESEVIR